MIPALIIWLIRKYGKSIRRQLLHHAPNIFSLTRKFILSTAFLVVLLFAMILVKGQEKQWKYKVIRNGDEVGMVNILSREDSNGWRVKAISEIKFRVIFRFSISVMEETWFHDNVMQYSSIYRKWNGNEKVNRQIKANGNTYLITNNGKTTTATYYPVYCHVLQLYVKEPVNIQQVYSENLQQFISLKKIADHTYKLLVSENDYNLYTYSKGVCTKVEVSHSFFSATLILQQ